MSHDKRFFRHFSSPLCCTSAQQDTFAETPGFDFRGILRGSSLILKIHYSLKNITVGHLAKAATMKLICNPSTSQMERRENASRESGQMEHKYTKVSPRTFEENWIVQQHEFWHELAVTPNILLPVSCSVTLVSCPHHTQATAESRHSAHRRRHSRVYMLYKARVLQPEQWVSLFYFTLHPLHRAVTALTWTNTLFSDTQAPNVL